MGKTYKRRDLVKKGFKKRNINAHSLEDPQFHQKVKESGKRYKRDWRSYDD
jgi:hypothetical protein